MIKVGLIGAVTEVADADSERAGKNPDLEKELHTVNKEIFGDITSLGGYYNEIKHFLQCIEQDEELSIFSLEEGIASFRLNMQEIKIAINKHGNEFTELKEI